MTTRPSVDPKRYLPTPPANLFRLSGGIKLIIDAKGKCQVIGIRPGRELHLNQRLANRGAFLRLF
ncbi:hypothetical protein AB4144_36620 [Rhizobiaceae sp. 2RAB30]